MAIEIRGFDAGSVDLLLRSDHNALPEEILETCQPLHFCRFFDLRCFWAVWGQFVMPQCQKFGFPAYLVDRLAICLGDKHLGGWTGVDTVEGVDL